MLMFLKQLLHNLGDIEKELWIKQKIKLFFFSEM